MRSGFAALLFIALAFPQEAHAYADPGSGAMLWQIAAAAILGSFFYFRRAVRWIRSHIDFQTQTARSKGFLFASGYALVASPLICGILQSRPLPRFNDVFLVGIVLTTYRFTWDAAVYLLAIGTLVSAWVLPPYGSLAVGQPEDLYRIFSFAALSVFLIALVHRVKKRAGSAGASRDTQAMPVRSMVAGD